MSSLSPTAITSFWSAGAAAVLQTGYEAIARGGSVRPALIASAAAGPVLGYATSNFLIAGASLGEETAASAAAGAILGYLNAPTGEAAGTVAASAAAGCLIGNGIHKL